MRLNVCIALLTLCGGVAVFAVAYRAQRGAEPEPVQPEESVLHEGTQPVPVLTIGSAVIQVAVADTQEERTQGLSGRPALPWDTGLLFVFPKSGYHSFWMPDMRFSIDIIWFDEAYRVVHIEEHVSPESYPTSFRPSAPARYVLEVPAGYAAEKGIVVGNVANVQ